jgi:hypothetical protein
MEVADTTVRLTDFSMNCAESRLEARYAGATPENGIPQVRLLPQFNLGQRY